jgi:hypothetical protein
MGSTGKPIVDHMYHPTKILQQEHQTLEAWIMIKGYQSAIWSLVVLVRLRIDFLIDNVLAGCLSNNFGFSIL